MMPCIARYSFPLSSFKQSEAPAFFIPAQQSQLVSFSALQFHCSQWLPFTVPSHIIGSPPSSMPHAQCSSASIASFRAVVSLSRSCRPASPLSVSHQINCVRTEISYAQCGTGLMLWSGFLFTLFHKSSYPFPQALPCTLCRCRSNQPQGLFLLQSKSDWSTHCRRLLTATLSSISQSHLVRVRLAVLRYWGRQHSPILILHPNLR